MEAKFGQTKDAIDFYILVRVFIIIFGVFVISCSENKLVGFLIFMAVYLPIDVFFMRYKGKIIADESGITVVRTLFGKEIIKKFIKYSEIQSADCGVDTIGIKSIGATRYTIEFTLRMKDDDSEIVFMSTMNIDNRFPAAEPDKYKEYLQEQPLMKISNYIDGKLHLNTSV